MYISRLTITCDKGILRDIRFHEGLNLIVDDTPEYDKKKTGNNVGKTTVLKLVDFCLGGDAKSIYMDPENNKSSYQEVEFFLEEGNVAVLLELVDRLDGRPSKKVTIERNFLKNARAVRMINGEQIPAGAFLKELGYELFPDLPEDGKPSFRQVISHNIRYKEYSIERTLRTLDPHTKNIEYEALHLYMLGCARDDAAAKQQLAARRKAEEKYIRQLRNGWSLNDYQAAITSLDKEIDDLEKKRAEYEDNSDLIVLVEESDKIKALLSQASSQLSQIELRIAITKEALSELANSASQIDLSKLEQLYREVEAFIPALQTSFEGLVAYHESMVSEKIRFIESELPELEAFRDAAQRELNSVLERDRRISEQLSKEMTNEDYESIIYETNKRYEQKGSYESLLSQLSEAENMLADTIAKLSRIEESERSGEFRKCVDDRVRAFNGYFEDISERLYGERYVLAVESKRDKSGTEYLDFHLVDVYNVSSGKKQGEILCFDIAYTEFADVMGIECLHFLLNDKKELMHGNQLSQVDRVAKECGVQIVVPMLADKLPVDMDEDRIVQRLSQESKLFRIEEFGTVNWMRT